jgi:hypothetical protein
MDPITMGYNPALLSLIFEFGFHPIGCGAVLPHHGDLWEWTPFPLDKQKQTTKHNDQTFHPD